MIALAVVLPLLGAFLLPLVGPLRHIFGPAILVAMIVLALTVWPQAQSEPFVVAIGDFQAPFGIVFYIDAIAVLFTLVVAVMGLLLWPWDASHNGTNKQVLTLIAVAACAGLAMSGDLFNLYVFYELVAVASYGLAAGRGSAAGYAATFRYVVLSSFASILALVGITLIYYQAGTLNLAHLAQLAPQALHNPVGIAAFLLLLLGLGVKAELFPINAWVPEVYATAEPRVAALLAGLVSKLAVLVLVRLLILVFPVAPAHLALLTLGTFSLLSGEFAAFHAKDLTRMFAWSSIGQLGIVCIAFAIPGEIGVMAGLAVAFHHLIAKPALFLLADRWGGNLERLLGLGHCAKLGGALFVLFALSLVGIPPLPGFWAKLLVVSGLAFQDGGMWWFAMAVVLITTVVEASYLFRVIGQLYHPAENLGEDDVLESHSPLALSSASVLGLCLIVGALEAEPLGNTLERIAVQANNRLAYIERVPLEASSTVFVGDSQ